jgi:hypothetical protein
MTAAWGLESISCCARKPLADADVIFLQADAYVISMGDVPPAAGPPCLPDPQRRSGAAGRARGVRAADARRRDSGRRGPACAHAHRTETWGARGPGRGARRRDGGRRGPACAHAHRTETWGVAVRSGSGAPVRGARGVNRARARHPGTVIGPLVVVHPRYPRDRRDRTRERMPGSRAARLAWGNEREPGRPLAATRRAAFQRRSRYGAPARGAPAATRGPAGSTRRPQAKSRLDHGSNAPIQLEETPLALGLTRLGLGLGRQARRPF